MEELIRNAFTTFILVCYIVTSRKNEEMQRELDKFRRYGGNERTAKKKGKIEKVVNDALDLSIVALFVWNVLEIALYAIGIR